MTENELYFGIFFLTGCFITTIIIFTLTFVKDILIKMLGTNPVNEGEKNQLDDANSIGSIRSAAGLDDAKKGKGRIHKSLPSGGWYSEEWN